MSERIMTRGFPWGEPAHPGRVKQYEDLINIYKGSAASFRTESIEPSDSVSRDIGFVVSTTLPVSPISRKAGRPVDVAEPLKGSLFETAILEAVNGSRRPTPGKAYRPVNITCTWSGSMP